MAKYPARSEQRLVKQNLIEEGYTRESIKSGYARDRSGDVPQLHGTEHTRERMDRVYGQQPSMYSRYSDIWQDPRDPSTPLEEMGFIPRNNVLDRL